MKVHYMHDPAYISQDILSKFYKGDQPLTLTSFYMWPFIIL